MTSDDADLARYMYSLERDDERVFWGSLSSLILGSLTLIAGAAIVLDSLPTTAYYLLPFIPVPAVCFYLHQGVVGARRREYMVALEHAIASGTTTCIEVSGVHRRAARGRSATRQLERIPLVAHQRYAWRLTAIDPDAATLSSRLLLIVMSLSPALLLAATLAASCVRVWNDGQHPGALLLGFVGASFYTALYVLFAGLLADHRVWTEPTPAMRD